MSHYRSLFLGDLQVLVRRGVLAEHEIPDTAPATSHKNLATSVGTLIALIRARWKDIESRTAITEAELAEAHFAMRELLFISTTRDLGPVTVSKASVVRQRAFTLLLKVYEELRRCFSFLRWYERDVDRFAPSLYQSQRTRTRKRKPKPEPSADAPDVTPGEVGASD